MQKEKLREMIDKEPCPTDKFKDLEKIIEMGGTEKLKVTRAFVYGTIVGNEAGK